MSEHLFSLLQSTAERHPHRIAVEFADRRMTYRDLRESVERFAGFLHDRGVRPGMHVAFNYRKSVEAIITLFGVIRTGAAYVPLDPAWPAQRVSDICEDASIRHWVGTQAPAIEIAGMELVVAAEFPASRQNSQAIAFDSAVNSKPIRGELQRPLDDVCNLLYTSGTTGRPKGVRITSRSLLHFSRWACDTFCLRPEDRIANHAAFHFDLSTLDIFGAVRSAAALHPVPDRIRGFPGEVNRFIDSHRITTWYSVPSALSQLIRVWNRGAAPTSLRHVLFAGEVMPKASVVELAKLLPQAGLANLYGPTETNVCTWHRVTSADLGDPDPLPIGIPIDDTRVWIDEAHSLGGSPLEAQESNSGELCVAGPTVAAGYHGHAAASDRFVPTPDGIGFAYRTGDRVRTRGDGALIFEGRMDRQFKTRGHRVEPGEIEAVIATHPAVREVAVVPVPDETFGHRVLACLSSNANTASDSGEIAEYCRARLPIYMVPDTWVIRETLPRTDRGKIDLRAIMSLAQV